MSLYQYFKARTLINRKQIVQHKGRGTGISFTCKDYQIYYLKKREWWSCTCEYGSLWSKQEKDCCHIMAAKLLSGWKLTEDKNGKQKS